jgi:hypothetical protein
MLVSRNSHAATYNSDACIPPNGLTREQNCGSDRQAADTAQAISIGGFVAAGVLGAVAGMLFLSADSPDATPANTPSAAVSCGGGPGLLGIACGASF